MPGRVRDMKPKYVREAGIILIGLLDDSYNYVQEANGVITLFTKQGKSLAIEIQCGEDFIFG